MTFRGPMLSTIVAMLVVVSALAVSYDARGQQVALPPPAPPLTLLDPVINEITYHVEIVNSGSSPVAFRADFAMPRMWSSDTYLEMIGVETTSGDMISYANRSNSYAYFLDSLESQRSLEVNITFLTLKYDLSVYTHNVVRNFSYPNEIAIYTQPETYIESNDSTIENVAAAAVGSSINPFRVAEKIYSFTISHLRYVSQTEIRGALWAFENSEGDCTEYSTLFVALMRAMGIPARTVTGHMSTVLSLGGVANATQYWTDSPHMWAEFYVEGYGWVPVDAASGENDPLNHFALSDSRYLPILKGQAMETPYRSLFTIQSEQTGSLEFNATLSVTPQSSLSFQNQAIVGFDIANNLINDMREAAESAYNYEFNVTSAYQLIKEAYDALHNASEMADLGDPGAMASHASLAEDEASQAVDMIHASVMDNAHSSVEKAWHEMRTLGALSGERYLRKAEDLKLDGDYSGMVKYAHYAKTAADDSLSIFLFVALVALSGATVWAIGRNSRKPAGL